MSDYKVFAINPGSTSTKIGLFEGEKCLFSKNVSHDAKELEKYDNLTKQLPYRKGMILDLLKEAGFSLDDVDVFVGRGGGLLAMEGGTYAVTDLVLEHARTCANGVVHPATLGSQLADEFAREYGAKAMVVNPPDVDEMQDLARLRSATAKRFCIKNMRTAIMWSAISEEASPSPPTGKDAWLTDMISSAVKARWPRPAAGIFLSPMCSPI